MCQQRVVLQFSDRIAFTANVDLENGLAGQGLINVLSGNALNILTGLALWVRCNQLLVGACNAPTQVIGDMANGGFLGKEVDVAIRQLGDEVDWLTRLADLVLNFLDSRIVLFDGGVGSIGVAGCFTELLSQVLPIVVGVVNHDGGGNSAELVIDLGSGVAALSGGNNKVGVFGSNSLNVAVIALVEAADIMLLSFVGPLLEEAITIGNSSVGDGAT